MRWDIIIYLETGTAIRYRSKTLTELFALVADWPARSNTPVVSFRARRSRLLATTQQETTT